MIARRLAQVLTLLVLVASGSYLLIYLYRWEWNRALVSGMFFIAAEVALAATTLLRRLQGVEERLEQLAARETFVLPTPEAAPVAPLAGSPAPTTGDAATRAPVAPDADDAAPTATPTPLERIRESAPAPSSPFAWLDPTDGRMGVFVPVLMGAGVVLSALAYLVERLAGVTAGAAVERGLARRIEVLTVPAGGFVTSAGFVPADLAVDRLRSCPPALRVRLRDAGRRIVAVAVVGLLTVTGIDLLADATQNRPDPAHSGVATTIDLDITHRRGSQSAFLMAEALWVACRGTLPQSIAASQISEVRAGRARMVLEPAIGEHSRRRFQGCLEDATFDKIQARVVSLRTTP